MSGATNRTCGKGLCTPSAITPTQGRATKAHRSDLTYSHSHAADASRCAGIENADMDIKRNCDDAARKSPARIARSGSLGQARRDRSITRITESAAITGWAHALRCAAMNAARIIALTGK